MRVDEDIERLLTRPVVMVDRQATIQRVAALLTDESIGVAVIQGTHPPALVSERDITTALGDGVDAGREHVENIANFDIAVASPHDSIEKVGRLMVESEVRHVPIVDGTAVVGVASMRDVLAVALGLTVD